MAFFDEAARLWVTIGADTRKLEAGLSRAERKMKGFGKSGSMLGGTIATGVYRAALAVVALGAGFVALGIKFNAMMEQSEIMFGAMIGDAARASVFFEDLKQMSVETPFQVTTLAAAGQRMLAYGIAVDKVLPTVTAVTDAMAALGGGDVGIQRVTVALGQMTAKSKVQAQEMRQLAESGINAWKFLAEYLETDVAGAMKLVEDRAVDGAEAVDAIVAGMVKQYGGMAKVLTTTMEGSWAVIKNVGSLIAGELTEPIFEELRDEMAKFANETLPQWLADIRKAKAGVGFEAEAFGEIRGRPPTPLEETALLGLGAAGVSYAQELYGVLLAQSESLRDQIAAQEKRIATREKTGIFPIGNIEKAKEQVEEWNRSLAATEAHMDALDEILRKDVAQQGIDVTAFTKTEKLVREMARHAVAFADAMQASVDSAIYWSSSIGGATTLKLMAGPELDPLVLKMLGKEVAAKEAEDRIAENEKANKEIADDYEKKLKNAIVTAHEDVKSRVEKILGSPTEVTAWDMFISTEAGADLFGPYEDKWDEYARRMRAAMEDPNGEWAFMIPVEVRVLGPEAVKGFGEREIDKFYSGERLDKIDWEAFDRMYEEAKKREDNMQTMFDMGAARHGVTPEDVRKTLGIQTPEDIANETMAAWGDAVDEFSPGSLIADKIETDMEENKPRFEKVAASMWGVMFEMIGKTPQNAQELFIAAIAPNLAAWLQDNGYMD